MKGMAVTKMQAATRHKLFAPMVFVTTLLAIFLSLVGCGSSQSSKPTSYQDCEIYDYSNNLLIGSETVYPYSRGDGAQVRGYYEDHQVYVLYIDSDYESWVKEGRSADNVTSGCYFIYTNDGSRYVMYYFDNNTKDGCWKINLYDKDGESAQLSIYLTEDGIFSYAGTTDGAGFNTPKERDRIDSKGEFYFDQARETMDNLDFTYLVRLNPETSTPWNELEEQPSQQQEDTAISDNELKAPEGSIDYSEAKSHIGETITVFGEVKASDYLSNSNYQPTYIDIGAAYPDESRVTMVVWGEDRGNFPGEPESIYLGKTICVEGELYEYEGVVYVKVETPDQIQVLD